LIAYAEKESGLNISNLISIDIGDGVGSGLVIGGKLFLGSSGMAGEFGHICVDIGGMQCGCGSRGCLESYISIPAIINKVSKITGTAALEDILTELKKGNASVIKIIDETAEILSYGINNIINFIDPELIIIDGNIKIFGDYFLRPLIKYLSQKKLLNRLVTVRYSEIEGNAVTLGGAKYAFDTIYS
jgi:Transcriptional regulator/sugar kinase